MLIEARPAQPVEPYEALQTRIAPAGIAQRLRAAVVVLPAATEFCRWVLAFQSLLAVDRFPPQSGVRLE